MACYGPFVAGKDGLIAVDCRECGYVHLMPRPSAEELDRLYEVEYYQSYNAGWFAKERREWWYWRAVYQERLREFYRLSGAAWDEPLFAFDWGAGCGWFVKAVSEAGAFVSVEGYEPNEYARRWANRNVTCKVVAGYGNCLKEHFIHCSLVLEHVLDPLRLLIRLYYYLRPGGLLCIVVPNEFNPLQQRLEGYSPVHQHHVNYFSPRSLRGLVHRAGFEIVEQLATFPMERLALSCLPYHKYPRLGIIAHWTRMIYEWSMLKTSREKWHLMRREWAEAGTGREIELWCRKM